MAQHPVAAPSSIRKTARGVRRNSTGAAAVCSMIPASRLVRCLLPSIWQPVTSRWRWRSAGRASVFTSSRYQQSRPVQSGRPCPRCRRQRRRCPRLRAVSQRGVSPRRANQRRQCRKMMSSFSLNLRERSRPPCPGLPQRSPDPIPNEAVFHRRSACHACATMANFFLAGSDVQRNA